MSLGGYPIHRIRSVPPSLYNKGYSIWFWEVVDPFECPMEPLTDEFWGEKMNSYLVYGIMVPGFLVTDKGALLILVARKLKYSNSNKVWGLSLQQKHELFDLIVQIDFTQVGGFNLMNGALRMSAFQNFADIFKNHILPFKDENGKFQRKPDDESESRLLKPDEKGWVQCWNCNRKIAPGSGLVILDRYPVSDGTVLIMAICEHCETMLAVQAKPP
jgi:ribosomal protein L24E